MSLHLINTLPYSNFHITMLGKKLVLGAIVTILSLATTVAADVVALSPGDFDKARICSAAC